MTGIEAYLSSHDQPVDQVEHAHQVITEFYSQPEQTARLTKGSTLPQTPESNTIQYNKNLYSAAIQKCPGALTTREEIYVYIDIKNKIESICVKSTLEEPPGQFINIAMKRLDAAILLDTL